ncbi:MAG: hypothetical protein JW852_04630 [Spirochaetales bacterium]|nr:hypothetical protein [Spirochaetales bacterium]
MIATTIIAGRRTQNQFISRIVNCEAVMRKGDCQEILIETDTIRGAVAGAEVHGDCPYL